MFGVGSGWSAVLGGVVVATGVVGVIGVVEVIGVVGAVGVAVLTAVVGVAEVALLTTVALAIRKKHKLVTVNLSVNLSVLQEA